MVARGPRDPPRHPARARRGSPAREEPEALEEAYALHVAQSRAWRGHRAAAARAVAAAARGRRGRARAAGAALHAAPRRGAGVRDAGARPSARDDAVVERRRPGGAAAARVPAACCGAVVEWATRAGRDARQPRRQRRRGTGGGVQGLARRAAWCATRCAGSTRPTRARRGGRWRALQRRAAGRAGRAGRRREDRHARRRGRRAHRRWVELVPRPRPRGAGLVARDAAAGARGRAAAAGAAAGLPALPAGAAGAAGARSSATGRTWWTRTSCPTTGCSARSPGAARCAVTAWGSDLLVTGGRGPAAPRARALRAAPRRPRAGRRREPGRGGPRAGRRRPRRVRMVPWGVDLERFAPAAEREPGLLVSARMHEPVYDVATILHGVKPVLERHPAGAPGRGGGRRPAARARARRRPRCCRRDAGGSSGGSRSTSWRRCSRGRTSTCRPRSRTRPRSRCSRPWRRAPLPVVSDIAGNREWVAEGEGARLFPCGDAAALARALERGAGRSRVGGGGARRATAAWSRSAPTGGATSCASRRSSSRSWPRGRGGGREPAPASAMLLLPAARGRRRAPRPGLHALAAASSAGTARWCARGRRTTG